MHTNTIRRVRRAPRAQTRPLSAEGRYALGACRAHSLAALRWPAVAEHHRDAARRAWLAALAARREGAR